MHSTTLVIVGVGFGWLLSQPVHRRIFGADWVPGSVADLGVLAVPRRGHLGDALFRQGLSHVVFHDIRAKSRLASLVGLSDGSKGAIGVVGVEFGGEVTMLAAEGYTVHAFEPMPKFLSIVEAKLGRNAAAAAKGLEPRWDVRLHRIAAGSQRNGSVLLKYQTEAANERAKVRVGRVDDYVAQELVVLSVDIQGSEIDVLRGASRLINGVGVRSLWIEIISCNKRVLEVFRLLDEKYVIFDFVPWGRPQSAAGGIADKTMNLIRHPSFMIEDGAKRPSEFDAFWNWMCMKQQKGGAYSWMQSDILAIRRDLIAPELMVKLASFSHDLYESIVNERRAARLAKQARAKPAK